MNITINSDNTFNIKTNYGKYDNCYLEENYYYNGNKRYDIVSDGEPILTLTTNTDTVLQENEISVKDYSENEGILNAFIDADLINPKIDYYIPSGFVRIPVVKPNKKFYTLVKAHEDI